MEDLLSFFALVVVALLTVSVVNYFMSIVKMAETCSQDNKHQVEALINRLQTIESTLKTQEQELLKRSEEIQAISRQNFAERVAMETRHKKEVEGLRAELKAFKNHHEAERIIAEERLRSETDTLKEAIGDVQGKTKEELVKQIQKNEAKITTISKLILPGYLQRIFLDDPATARRAHITEEERLEGLGLLTSCWDSIDRPDEHGRTLLFNAISSPKCPLGIPKYLVEHGADVNRADENGNAPLHAACAWGTLAFAQLLVEHGADVNAAAGKDGASALHCAAATDDVSIAKFLLENGADVNGVDKAGKTALHTACSSGKPAVARLLIEKGADVNREDRTRRKPLAYSRNAEVIHVLQQNGAFNQSGHSFTYAYAYNK